MLMVRRGIAPAALMKMSVSMISSEWSTPLALRAGVAVRYQPQRGAPVQVGAVGVLIGYHDRRAVVEFPASWRIDGDPSPWRAELDPGELRLALPCLVCDRLVGHDPTLLHPPVDWLAGV
jgi:hypothetical protein